MRIRFFNESFLKTILKHKRIKYQLNILVIAAHPDDEVLGMGGTIKKLTKKKNRVDLCVISEGASAQYKNENMIKVRKEACKKAGKILGISSITFLDYPDMQLDKISHLELNIKLEEIIQTKKPQIVYTTPYNDLNKDHQIVFDSTLVATRPKSNYVKEILCYELPGFSKTPFHPTIYEDISLEISMKLKAFKCYKSEIQLHPLPRTFDAINNLATIRGIESGLKKAESFQLIKKIIS